MVEVGDLAIEPEMDAGDRRSLEAAESLPQRLGRRGLGQQARQHVERHGGNHEIKALFAAPASHKQLHVGKLGAE